MNVEIPEHLQSSEWVRLPKPLGRLEGLSRTSLGELIDSNLVESVTLRQPGAQRGIKLIFLPSLRKYLHDLATKQVRDKEAAVRKRKPALKNSHVAQQ
jgi:hypothetical protein